MSSSNKKQHRLKPDARRDSPPLAAVRFWSARALHRALRRVRESAPGAPRDRRRLAPRLRLHPLFTVGLTRSRSDLARARGWRGETVPTLLALLLAVLSAGCPSARRCSSVESCNLRDDDCDGRVDEDFVDERGRYVEDDHCGRCGLTCEEVFPGASDTTCNSAPEAPVCELVACPTGTHAFKDGSCIPDQPVLCLPCSSDDDCGARTPGARCVGVNGELRCGEPCKSDRDCDAPFRCDAAAGQCRPEPSLCACQDVSASFSVACLAQGTAPNLFCAGVSTCGPSGLGKCEIASTESCDGEDDDCDGLIDEGFVDARGSYVGPLHCGGCGKPCSAPGPNYDAQCAAVGNLVSCQIECRRGFVDVDGIRANGCECQLFDGSSAPAVVGGDANCDGLVDDSDSFVHVTTGGTDGEAGTLIKPLRSLDAAIARAAVERKSVLVAQGSYEPFAIVAGVSVFGGYRADFQARDPERYPVIIEGGARDGSPVLTCRGVRGAAVVEGLTLRGSDATSVGGGSTTALFDGCGPEVKLSQVTVLAARGADGARGDSASARLPMEIASLAALNGRDAQGGRDGDRENLACIAQPGGSGGQKLCGAQEVSGGTGGGSGCPETGCVNGRACGNAGCTDFTDAAGVCDYARVLQLAVPNPAAGAGRGVAPGGAGAQTYNSPTNRGICNFCDDNPTLQRLGQDGSDGASGSNGAAGAGCLDAALTFDPSGRASSGAGLAGPGGTDGSGGGGGSAGSGYDVIGGTNGVCDDTAGGSGGGGGSGGCGAPGGAGGGGGGASLGVVVRLTPEGVGPVFDRVRVVTASGGRGGDGGIGAEGGRGGAGALGGRSRFFCARNGGRGGDGGDGGAGGGGGGGCGGASHALFVAGANPAAYRASTRGALSIERTGVPGQGGRGGFSPGQSGTPGAVGAPEAVP
jgi:hypothetical protein